MQTTAEVKPAGTKARREAGKIQKELAKFIDLGPSRPRQIMIPDRLWRDLSHKSIDDDATVSALFVLFAAREMAKAGHPYRLQETSANQASGVNNSGEPEPVPETLPLCEVPAEGAIAGAGEGIEPQPDKPRLGRRQRHAV